MLDRVLEEDARLSRITKEKEKAETELKAKCLELEEVAAKKAELDAQAELMTGELCKIKSEHYEMQAKLIAEGKKVAALAAELEGEVKAKEALQASSQAEVDAAFLEGAAEAGRSYTAQVKKLSSKLYQHGFRAGLKEMGADEDHPLYVNPPEFDPATLAPQAPAEADTSSPPEAHTETPAIPSPEAQAEASTPAEVAQPGDAAIVIIDEAGAGTS